MISRTLYGKKYFEEYGDGNCPYQEQTNNPTFNKRLDELKALGVEKGKILDIGCAYGYFLRACEKRGFITYGVDISEYAINKAKRICNAELKIVDVQESKIPYKNSSIDAIFLMDILEHLENPYILLREVFRLLKRGGIVYIHLPTIQRAMKDETHKTFLTISALIKIMSLFPCLPLKLGEEGGKLSNYFAVFRLMTKGNTFFNFVPKGTGSFISAYFRKI